MKTTAGCNCNGCNYSKSGQLGELLSLNITSLESQLTVQAIAIDEIEYYSTFSIFSDSIFVSIFTVNADTSVDDFATIVVSGTLSSTRYQ